MAGPECVHEGVNTRVRACPCACAHRCVGTGGVCVRTRVSVLAWFRVALGVQACVGAHNTCARARVCLRAYEGGTCSFSGSRQRGCKEDFAAGAGGELPWDVGSGRRSAPTLHPPRVGARMSPQPSPPPDPVPCRGEGRQTKPEDGIHLPVHLRPEPRTCSLEASHTPALVSGQPW